MLELSISREYLVYTDSSSKGMIPKYYKDGYWYKLNQMGYESKSEYIVSELLKSSNIEDFVEYQECVVNGRNACVSHDFLHEDEVFKSFKKIYYAYTGLNLHEDILKYREVDSRISFVIDFFADKLGLDIKEYLQNILWLDCFTLNNDRHFGNLGFICNTSSGEIRTAPIFDNGSALLSNFSIYSIYDSIEDNVSKVVGCPFSGSLIAQASYFENPYHFDLSFLEGIEDCRAKSILVYRLKQLGIM